MNYFKVKSSIVLMEVIQISLKSCCRTVCVLDLELN